MEANVPQPGSNEVKPDDNKKEDTKKRARKRKSKQGVDLTCPMKILESVLSTASYKVPNLSQEVERKFYHTADYSKELARLLEDVVYLPTVGEVNEYQSDVPISVFPLGFEGHVEVPPSAIMSLTCINAKHKRRLKWGRGKGNKGKVKNSNVKDVEKGVTKEKNVNGDNSERQQTSVNEKKKEEELETKQSDNNQTTITETKTDINRVFNGQTLIETVAGNGTDGKKKKKKKNKKQGEQNVDEKSGNIETNGEV